MSTIKYVNSAAIADMLGVSKRKVDMMAASKEIPFVKVGNVRRFDPERVSRTLEARTKSQLETV